MGLRLKFNLVLLIVFALGLGVTGYISHDLPQRNARDEAEIYLLIADEIKDPAERKNFVRKAVSASGRR